MDPLAQEQHPRLACEQLPFQPQREFGIREVRAEATLSETVLATDFALMLAGAAAGQQHHRVIRIFELAARCAL